MKNETKGDIIKNKVESCKIKGTAFHRNCLEVVRSVEENCKVSLDKVVFTDMLQVGNKSAWEPFT